MSALGKWALGIGLIALVVAVLCTGPLLDFVTVSIIAGLVAIFGIGVGVYDALYEWMARINLRRRARKVQQERERGERP